jgi:hypothetical protein
VWDCVDLFLGLEIISSGVITKQAKWYER